jgi:hypothetical protein
MKWVTWEEVGVDRMGCSWLIRRFIDPGAEFVFVPARHGTLPDDAEPFDIPGTRLSHRRGHASFRTFLEEYRLEDPVLARIARMIDEVDTAQEALVEPAAPGLDLLCDGIRRTSRDDHEAIDRGQMIYEALYAQLAAEPAE